MTSEQLQIARAERWRQASNPIVTADDARGWLENAGLSLFLPVRAHFSAPAPSFVEAVAGASGDAAGKAALTDAVALLRRLAAERAVLPLSLFGGAGPSDQPDFLVSREALPYVFSLIGGRNWKSGPGGKASPLMVEIWTLLNREGSLTAQEIQTVLGRELTEAAVLRSLLELWNGLRVIPVYEEEGTRWELTQARFAEELTASQKVAQTTALSALVSLYLESVIAASSEEIEAFLSPLAARSRVREVINGLQATRQLAIVSVAAQPLLHVPGSLPEFAEAEPEEIVLKTEHKPREHADGFGQRKPFDRQRSERPRGRTEFTRENRGRERREFDRPRATSERKNESRGGEERPFRKRPQEGRPFEGGRKPFGKKPFGKKPFDKEQKPFDGERPAKRFDGGRGRPWQERGERPFRGRHEDGTERTDKRREGRFESGRKFSAPKKFDRPRSFGDAKPSRDAKLGRGREEGRSDKSSFGPRRFDKGEPRSGSGRSSGGKYDRPRSTGEGRSFRRDKPDEKRPFFRERPARNGDGESRPREFRSQGSAGGGKTRPSSGFSKTGKPGFKSSGRPAFKSGGKPGFKSGGKPSFKSSGKPGFKSAGKTTGFKKPGFGKAGKPAFGKGKPAFGKNKPGGFRPPTRRRRDEGSGETE